MPLASAHFIVIRSHSRTCRCCLQVFVCRLLEGFRLAAAAARELSPF
ncbi:hypothetical protein [Methanimicrococcus hongohii]|nr:hypothetical protein [Methanimicrococcus sp. Hf6]